MMNEHDTNENEISAERQMSRRLFLGSVVVSGGALLLEQTGCGHAETGRGPLFRISLAEWSLHRTIWRTEAGPPPEGKIVNLDFPGVARSTYGIDAVEYVNTFFFDKAKDRLYLEELKKRAADAGVRSLLIMCDGEGAIGAPEEAERLTTVENHKKWLDAAAYLGCHSIRVNAQSQGSREEQQRLAADGLHRLAEYADTVGLNVLVENHGGYSSDGSWLAGTIALASHRRLGTLPDFGNFTVSEETQYDRYLGVKEMMPYARAVSAKSHAFNEAGDETATDFRRMLRVVLDAGYRGYVGVEYEGSGLSEGDGIRATKSLLERVRDELAPSYS
jgi:L-ribulose-5-phosphate 3-epimerase